MEREGVITQKVIRAPTHEPDVPVKAVLKSSWFGFSNLSQLNYRRTKKFTTHGRYFSRVCRRVAVADGPETGAESCAAGPLRHARASLTIAGMLS